MSLQEGMLSSRCADQDLKSIKASRSQWDDTPMQQREL